jgi:hypothetical protein
MTEMVESPTSTGEHAESQRPRIFQVGRFALGVATGIVLAVALLAACGADSTEWDIVTVNQHLFVKDPAGTKFEISVVKDSTGKDTLTAIRVGD